jgi:hypothetical protein
VKLLIPLMLVSFNAFAFGSNATSIAGANSTAIAGSASISGASSKANQVVSVNPSTSYNEVKQYKNTPSMVAPDIAPTSPCMGSSSAGGAIAGFGISGGSSWTDDECNTRETTRLFYLMNMKEDALAVLCSSVYSKHAPSCKEFRKAQCHPDEIVAKRLNVDVCK